MYECLHKHMTYLIIEFSHIVAIAWEIEDQVSWGMSLIQECLHLSQMVAVIGIIMRIWHGCRREWG